MKRSLLLIAVLFVSNFVLAQNQEEYNTLKSHTGTIEIRGMGGPLCFLSANHTEFTAFAGGGGAVLLNRSIYLGGFGVSAIGGMNPDGYDDPEAFRNYFDIGGIWTGYVFQPGKVFHPVIDLKIGWGNFAIHDLFADEYMNLGVYSIQPSFQIEANINSFLQVDLGVHYRYVSPLDLYVYQTASLSGVGFDITFKFGWFGPF